MVKNKSVPFLDLVVFSMLSPIAVFLISSNWLFPLIGLVLSGLCSFGVYKIRDDNSKERRIQKATDSFLSAYFENFNVSHNSEEAFDSSSSFLKETGINKTYQQVKDNPHLVESWHLGIYREAFIASLEEKDLPIVVSYQPSETVDKSEQNYNKEMEILYTSLAVLIMIAIVRVIYGSRIFQGQDLGFLILLDLMCVVPNGAILAYEYLKRRK